MHRFLGVLLVVLAAVGCGSGRDKESAQASPDNPANQRPPSSAAEAESPADAAWLQRNAAREQAAATVVAAAAKPDDDAAESVEPEASEPRPAPAVLDLADLIDRVEPAVVRIDVDLAGGSGQGSGFVVDDQGTIVTNYHVLDGARSARVTFRDGTTLDISGTLLLRPEQDIAVARLKLDGKPRTWSVLSLAAAVPRKGEAVTAFGAPQGLSFTASEGIVSALRTSAELEQELGEQTPLKDVSLIQTDAAISPGSSGGPLVNRAGEVVGVTTLTHRIGQNLNFAVSSGHVRQAIADAARGKLTAFSPRARRRAAPASRVANIPGVRQQIEEALLESRQRFRAALEQRREELEQLETELQTAEHLMAVVRAGGKEAFDVIRNFPLGNTRAAWLRVARDQVEGLTRRIEEDRADLDRDVEFSDQGMFPPPRLGRGRPAPGDFGFVQAHVRVTRVLDDGSFLGEYGDHELHWRGFPVDVPEPGELVLISAMCVAAAPYTFTNSVGAPESTISLEPLEDRLIPDWYRDALKKRIEVQTARLKSRLEAWQARTAQAQAAVDAGGPLPKLGTRFEPSALIEIIAGGKTLKAPVLEKKYRNEVVTIRYPRLGGSGGGIVYDEARSVRRVETEESKQWRRKQLEAFNALRSVYPTHSLTDFISELQEWSTDSELLYNHQGELRQDIDQLIKLAFVDYGIDSPRAQDIPWSAETKLQLTAHLKHMAIRYGELSEDLLLASEEEAAAAEADSPADPAEEARREAAAANQLEFAQRFIVGGRPKRGKEAEARKWLEAVIEKFPGTKAAEEAGELMQRFQFD